MQPELQQTRRALTLRYGVLVSTLLGVFALGVYGQVSHLREAQTRLQLERIASTAAAELQLLHHEHDEMQRADVPAWLREQAQSALTADPAREDPDVMIRWFDDELLELKTRGGYRSSTSTIPPVSSRGHPQWLELKDGLALWRPVVHRSAPGAMPRLEGYVSVALASAAADGELARLRQGLLIGALLAGLAGAASSHWMVRASLEPIRRQIERLIRFTADASHELRHPLTAIRALIGTLRHGELLAGCPARVAQKLEQIDQSTVRMGRLVDDLLLLSRSDRAIDDSSAMQDFPLEDLVEDVIALHQAEAQAAGLELEGAIESSARVHGHPERLRQLLENLLSNALRFSPPRGRVSVGISPRQETVLLWVDDQGPGIPAEQRSQVFERFWQADPARSNPDHLGLGLSIAQAIAQAHDGRLQACEAPSGGCRMLLELPLQGRGRD
ncbi:MAG: sensor histidine kinase [Cyanobium sp.]